jgi:hypothetical protein
MQIAMNHGCKLLKKKGFPDLILPDEDCFSETLNSRTLSGIMKR